MPGRRRRCQDVLVFLCLIGVALVAARHDGGDGGADRSWPSPPHGNNCGPRRRQWRRLLLRRAHWTTLPLSMHNHDFLLLRGGGGKGSSRQSGHDNHVQQRGTAPSTTRTTVTFVPSSITAATADFNATKHKMRNLQTRVWPALALLAGLAVIVKQFHARGLQYLAFALSAGLYHEFVNVIDLPPPGWIVSAAAAAAVPAPLPPAPTDNNDAQGQHLGVVLKWTIFVAASLHTTIPVLFAPEQLRQVGGILPLCSVSLVLGGLMSSVWHLNCNGNDALPLMEFRYTVSQWATYMGAAVLSLVPCQSWILTLQHYDQAWLLYALALVIENDILAYAVGVTLGQRPLLPRISPKKTVEGFVGATVGTMALSYLTWQLLMPVGYNRHAFVVALFCNLSAPFGGYCGSVMKRAYGKNDFGEFLPGHGGWVDRLDCQLWTAPFLYAYLRAFVSPNHHKAMSF